DIPHAAVQRIGKRAVAPLVRRTDASRFGDGVHRGCPCDLRIRFTAPFGGAGGHSLRGEAIAQCGAPDSTGLRDGYAVSQRTARLVVLRFWPRWRPGKT